MHHQPANSQIGEGLVALYEQKLAATLGYTNSDIGYADTIQGFGQNNIMSLATSSNNSYVRNARNYQKNSSTQEVGTVIQTDGNLSLNAGNNLTARAANVTSDNGALSANAGNDLSIEAGINTSHAESASYNKKSGTFSSKSKTRRDTANSTDVISSTFSGESVDISAGTGAGVGSDSGDASSTTVSGISSGTVNITDSTKQTVLTGKDAAVSVALINRDVKVNENGEAVDSQGNSTAHTIATIFDKEKVAREIQAQVQITQAFIFYKNIRTSRQYGTRFFNGR